jgi:hypothetical protein
LLARTFHLPETAEENDRIVKRTKLRRHTVYGSPPHTNRGSPRIQQFRRLSPHPSPDYPGQIRNSDCRAGASMF